MVEPVSAIAIVSTVVKAVTTSVTTAQTISDYVSRYDIAGVQIIAMKTECSTVLTALLALQDIILQTDVLHQPLEGEGSQRLAYVQTDYRGILTQCFAVFTFLNERLEKLNVQQLNKRSQSSAKAKIRAVWSDSSMKELRGNIKGQVSAITLLLNTFQVGLGARMIDSIAANTASGANNSQMLTKIFQILTLPENAALLKRVADDTRSLSSRPLARNVIKLDEDAQSVFEGQGSIPRDRPNYNDGYQRSNRARNSTKLDKDATSSLNSDRFSFVTARSKIIPSIRSFLGSRSASVRSNGSLDSTLYGASTIRRVPQAQQQAQAQTQIEMQTPVNPVDMRNSHGVSEEEATRTSIDDLQDIQKARWEYLVGLSPQQVVLDETIEEYEEREKEFEERANLLKAQISKFPF